MLTCALGEAFRRELLYGNAAANLGGVFENAVIQELTVHAYPVYYYNSKRLGELDFVIEHHGGILPIEVKSGKDYDLHSAINNVLNIKDFAISEAAVFSGYNLSCTDRITYYPVYMAGFLTEETDWPALKRIEI